VHLEYILAVHTPILKIMIISQHDIMLIITIINSLTPLYRPYVSLLILTNEIDAFELRIHMYLCMHAIIHPIH